MRTISTKENNKTVLKLPRKSLSYNLVGFEAVLFTMFDFYRNDMFKLPQDRAIMIGLITYAIYATFIICGIRLYYSFKYPRKIEILDGKVRLLSFFLNALIPATNITIVEDKDDKFTGLSNKFDVNEPAFLVINRDNASMYILVEKDELEKLK